jgi:3-oxoacyl-[acyl-carrier protein] reductase
MKKIILITGTRKGIGRFLCDYYLSKDFIVIGCSRGPSDLEDPNYRHYCLDIANEVDVKNMFIDVSSKYGRLDFLVNNAGVASMNHSLLTPIKTVKKILDTNVVGNFIFSREAAKLMKKNKFGRIINFATFAIPFRLEGEAIYAASKAAVVTLTEVLSREYAPYNITVNAVAPPAVQTDLIKGVARDKMDRLIKRQSIQRFGTPKEVASVIDFFLNEDNDMVNGQIIYMGGL